jgi:hypothetical protein
VTLAGPGALALRPARDATKDSPSGAGGGEGGRDGICDNRAALVPDDGTAATADSVGTLVFGEARPGGIGAEGTAFVPGDRRAGSGAGVGEGRAISMATIFERLTAGRSQPFFDP